MQKYHVVVKCFFMSAVALLLNGCGSFGMTSSTASLSQYRWVMEAFSYPGYEMSYAVRLDFDGQQIAIAPGCDRVTSKVQTASGVIQFDKIKSTKLKCKVSTLRWDKIIIDEIQDAKILKIDASKLILQSSNGYKMVFKSLPKLGQKGVIAHLWEISPKKISCTTDPAKSCLKVRNDANSEWRIFEGDITDFTFKEGVLYRVRVLETTNTYQPKYSLDAILSQALVGTRQP